MKLTITIDVDTDIDTVDNFIESVTKGLKAFLDLYPFQTAVTIEEEDN